jgi:hypothetical protein
MPKFYENVKSRLNKQGIKGIPRSDYDLLSIELGVTDNDSATTEQVIQAVKYFTNKMSNQLSTTSHIIDDEYLVTDDEHLVTDDEHLSEIVISQNAMIDTLNKGSIVSIGQDMGVVLSDSDVDAVANSLNQYGDDLTDNLADIRYAITQFIHHKYKENRRNINSMMDVVRASMSESNQELSKELSDGLKGISDDINKSNTDFKSSIARNLQKFSVPF